MAGSLSNLPSEAFFVKLELHHQEQVAVKKKTRALKALGGQCQWRETFHFLLSALDPVGSLSVRLYSRSSVRRKQCLGQVRRNTHGRLQLTSSCHSFIV